MFTSTWLGLAVPFSEARRLRLRPSFRHMVSPFSRAWALEQGFQTSEAAHVNPSVLCFLQSSNFRSRCGTCQDIVDDQFLDTTLDDTSFFSEQIQRFTGCYGGCGVVVMPLTTFMGVRISWDMRERSVLARLVTTLDFIIKSMIFTSSFSSLRCSIVLKALLIDLQKLMETPHIRHGMSQIPRRAGRKAISIPSLNCGRPDVLVGPWRSRLKVSPRREILPHLIRAPARAWYEKRYASNGPVG